MSALLSDSGFVEENTEGHGIMSIPCTIKKKSTSQNECIIVNSSTAGPSCIPSYYLNKLKTYEYYGIVKTIT